MLQIQRSEFNSRPYQIFWEVVGLERGSFSPVSTTEELLGRKSRGSGLEHQEYGRGYPLRLPRDTLYPQKLTLACSSCWASTAQSFSGPSSAGLMTKFYCLNFETPPQLEDPNGLCYRHQKSKSCYDWRSISQYVFVSSSLRNLWPDIIALLSLWGRPLWREVGSVSCQLCLVHCQSLILFTFYLSHVLCIYNIYKASVTPAQYRSLDIWTVVHLTAAKFKPLIFSALGFALSYIAEICIFMQMLP
jgi:hypothetical protein